MTEAFPITIAADKIQPHDIRPTSGWTSLDGETTTDTKGGPVSQVLNDMLAKARSQKARDEVLRGSFTISADGYAYAPSSQEPEPPNDEPPNQQTTPEPSR